jgi:hypothetical protein
LKRLSRSRRLSPRAGAAGFEFDPQRIHHLVEEAHHRHAEHDPFRIAARDGAQQFGALGFLRSVAGMIAQRSSRVNPGGIACGVSILAEERSTGSNQVG